MGKRKVWVEPLFAEAKQWHGMRRLRLRQLWRVNCEALVVASGQNLKRLLQKRGWGRRPFPAQAMALMPPESSQAELMPRNVLLKNQRASTAVASLASWKVAQTFFEAQESRFFGKNPYCRSFLFLRTIVFCFLSLLFFLILSITDISQFGKTPCAFKLMRSFRNSANVFQQAGAIRCDKICVA
jgi:hypothetical protein